ncbi:D-amino acid dehydrogenase [Pseudoroseicyclus aestuarii]|uniref:Glycine/D-amino acid oxidase-like deaminating enzyme n=1 Tax=Pseudoroseicyclus aestuarii TaxID=1795041 RepID=A0A318T741_9RHOB|nr:D-amino acid dehydrogenase [Pseudoroseicyclus aestuarii]PYE84218.1 glycine/D-amino acid oxidase-like deaminating enzyme [Pseudoroseicyclus aestuarii]
MPHVAVLGAGITGITTAYALHRRGYDVTVFDRQRYAGMDTSFANGGQLSASNAEVWNRWGTVAKGLKWLLDPAAPLSVNPRPSWHKLSWMAEFLAAIPSYERNTVETARLAIAARAGMAEMAETAGLDFDFSRAGIVHFYKTEKELEAARRVSALLAKGGLPREELSADEVRAAVPQLHGPVVGGFLTESDSTGDIHRFTFGLAEWLRGQGVTFRMGREIRDVSTGPDAAVVTTDEPHRFDAVVVAAGIGSRALARRLGDRVNVYPVKGYSITVNLADQASREAAPTASLLDDAAKIVTSRLGNGRFRVAGTAEFNGENRDIRADRVQPLIAWVERHFPDVSTESCVPWAGLRPMMPNMMPRVGPGRRARVFYNTGHGHLGWTLSAATAEVLAGSLAGQIEAPARSTGRLSTVAA